MENASYHKIAIGDTFFEALLFARLILENRITHFVCVCAHVRVYRQLVSYGNISMYTSFLCGRYSAA